MQLSRQHAPASHSSSIVSLACRYPAASSAAAGNVTGQQGFWGNLADGVNLQAPVPLARWDINRWYAPNLEPHRMYVPFGSFVDGVDVFDASLFGLAAGEALALDPQARILLEQTHVALMQGRLGSASGATGVYIGCMYTEYLDSILGPQGLADSNSSSIIGHGLSFLVGRVSYTFGLAGPCISTDTACSSSLVALHLANQGLAAGQTQAAVAGGVNIMLEPRTTARICLLQALSPVGRCKTFDATGDGYGRGEGFAVAVLRWAHSSGLTVVSWTLPSSHSLWAGPSKDRLTPCIKPCTFASTMTIVCGLSCLMPRITLLHWRRPFAKHQVDMPSRSSRLALHISSEKLS